MLFLAKFRNDWYKSLDDISVLTYESVKAFATDGLKYVEIRFAPETFATLNNFNRAETTRTVIKAAESAAAETGLMVRFIITFVRGKIDVQQMLKLYDTIANLALPGIVGIDLAGDELHFPPGQYKPLFDQVNKDNIFSSTVHAGEVTPSNRIWEAIEYLGAKRIGHGTSAIQDQQLQEYLIRNFICLEQCITSNYQTGSWSDEAHHPIAYLFKKGVPTTLNSDDPFIQDSDLTDDYIKALKYFHFTLEDLIKLNINAIKGSFLTPVEKQALETEYKKEILAFMKDNPSPF